VVGTAYARDAHGRNGKVAAWATVATNNSHDDCQVGRGEPTQQLWIMPPLYIRGSAHRWLHRTAVAPPALASTPAVHVLFRFVCGWYRLAVHAGRIAIPYCAWAPSLLPPVWRPLC
jgi:hypothetical protein